MRGPALPTSCLLSSPLSPHPSLSLALFPIPAIWSEGSLLVLSPMVWVPPFRSPRHTLMHTRLPYRALHCTALPCLTLASLAMLCLLHCLASCCIALSTATTTRADREGTILYPSGGAEGRYPLPWGEQGDPTPI